MKEFTPSTVIKVENYIYGLQMRFQILIIMIRRLGMYRNYIKRISDFVISLILLIVLSPVFLVLSLLGILFMQGNPFFIQKRPGRNEKIFSLIKFRTMDCRKDVEGKFLPDEVRLNRYGRFLRKTSMDEIPELFNIIKGDMSFIGPRPLLVEYLPWYSEEEKHRHDVRPGLTGLAQVNGRNFLPWDERLRLDIEYVNNISFKNDFKIFVMTITKVIMSQNIAVDSSQVESNLAEERREKAKDR